MNPFSVLSSKRYFHLNVWLFQCFSLTFKPQCTPIPEFPILIPISCSYRLRFWYVAITDFCMTAAPSLTPPKPYSITAVNSLQTGNPFSSNPFHYYYLPISRFAFHFRFINAMDPCLIVSEHVYTNFCHPFSTHSQVNDIRLGFLTRYIDPFLIDHSDQLILLINVW